VSQLMRDRSRFQPARVLIRCVVVVGAVTLAGAVPAQADTRAVHDAQWALQSVDVERVWELSRGDGVVVAVIDTGVDAQHGDLEGQVLRGDDFGDGSSGDGTHDGGRDRGHGTQVASLIAGTAGNFGGDGLFGLAPGSKILPFGAYRNDEPDSEAVAEAVRTAVRRGSAVMVMPSLTAQRGDGLEAAVRYAIDHDVVVISGVGDMGDQATASEASGPTPLPGVVAVTAVDRDGRLWERTERSVDVALAAPGVGILAAASDGAYWTGDDTGFAAAWVAGAAALVRAAHPDWSSAQTIQKLLDTADHRGDPGRNEAFGYGVVDPLQALTDTSIPAASVNPLLAVDSAQASGGSVTRVGVGGSTSTDSGPSLLLLAVAAAVAGMLLFFVVLRAVGRMLPADRTVEETGEGRGTTSHDRIR
jgi:subtilisin family serine protease